MIQTDLFILSHFGIYSCTYIGREYFNWLILEVQCTSVAVTNKLLKESAIKKLDQITYHFRWISVSSSCMSLITELIELINLFTFEFMPQVSFLIHSETLKSTIINQTISICPNRALARVLL